MDPTVFQSPSHLRKRHTDAKFTVAEVAKHNTPTDCWIIVDGKVYDVTGWIANHPGGQKIILGYAGMDATDVYDAFHDIEEESHIKMRSVFCVGEVVDQSIPESVKEFRALKRQLKKENFFKTNPLFYVGLATMGLSMWSASVFLVSAFPKQLWSVVLGAILLAFFWLQLGWFGHDVHHNQVYARSQKKWKSLTCRIGEVFLGFTTSWWNNKHNMHHAVPNIKGADPDIDTFPLLAWADLILEGERLTGLPHFLIKHQHFIYPVLLCLARLAWAIKSVLYSYKHSKTHEVIAIGLHYTWYFYLMINYMTLNQALIFVAVSQGLGGLLLSSAFSVNHNGMDVFPRGTQATMEFHKLQTLTGRDVTGGAWVPWFMGGLDKQVEHHLLPRVPRHNLQSTRQLIQDFCKKYNIRYHSTDFWTGTKETVQRLYDVSTTVH